MKLFHLTTRLFLTTALVALPLASFAADDKPADTSALTQPVKSVLDHYLAIQAGLANDSIKGLDENATAIAKAVRGDEAKLLSPDVAAQAETLAKASDLAAARAAFKPLSQSLIKYLADHPAGKDTYHQAYCPMARASWLQTGTDIQNPYLGQEMPTCGQFKN